jgi:D-alanyl-D-alanine carboxypeptidase
LHTGESGGTRVTTLHARIGPAAHVTRALSGHQWLGVTAALVGVVFALLLQAGCAHGRAAVTEHQQGVDPRLAGRLQSILDKERKLFAAGGASAAIVIPDEGLWTGASGIADPKTGEPVTTRTVFALGSVSKTFTATLVLKLAEEGLLHLDDPLARWLHHFPRANQITIRELLNHTSGVYDVTEDPSFLEAQFKHPRERWTERRILSYLGHPLFKPGADWSYSNTNYVLLGMVIERASGSSVARELHREILEPAHADAVFVQGQERVPDPVMRTRFDIDLDGDADDLSDGTTTIPNTALATAAWSAGGMAATPEAVADFGDALFRGHLLQAESLREMTDFSAELGKGRGGGLGYGLGVSRFEIPGHEVFGHGGAIPGFRSAIWYVADEKVTIAFCWNDAELDPTLVIQPLLDAVTAHLEEEH